MSAGIILGGTGYIGRRWAERLIRKQLLQQVFLADQRPPAGVLLEGVEYRPCDVRQPLEPQLGRLLPEWIFDFAAVHREPGHTSAEYFDTNLPGARHATAYAEVTSCPNILFTSTIAVYGPARGPTSEQSPLYPQSPYGISKVCAELIHEGWQGAGAGRRLLVCRPGVIYGPGDPGNILRMIRAVRRGYFVFPGPATLRKSYGYIEGLLDSFEFAMARPEPALTYNYVEAETEPIGELVRIVARLLERRVPVLSAPTSMLVALAAVIQAVSGGRSPIHPVRVRKAATSTHIVPKVLKDLGFPFRYDFRSSLEHWRTIAPEDFA